MSTVSKFLDAIKSVGHKTRNPVKHTYGIPTVKFDPSVVTEIVKADIRKNVELLEGIAPEYFDQIYDATVRAVTAGYDLHLLCNAIIGMNIEGMTKGRKGRAAQIALFLSNKVKTVIENTRRIELGITDAIWQYSGAPCEINLRQPSGQDVSHAEADGKHYKISEGMRIDGKYIWPGYEDGCRCTSRAVIPGFED